MKLFKPHLILRRVVGRLLPSRLIPLGRMRTCDVAYPYRMGAGFAGDVNRTHPASIEPCLIDPNAPPMAYGQAVVIDATSQGVRPLVAGDQALTAVYGITVRPYPQQTRAGGDSSPFGSATPPTSGVIDILRSGFIMVPVVGSPIKGATVYIWTAAAAGAHVQGGFEYVNPAGSGMNISDSKTTFNGPPDSSGITELAFNV